ncbi:APGW-amide-related neuropeptide-like [Saccostrea echinata]|uniref:APGW-amide-related neuropeptide-like n=1 Tax=Saccostrea echinata TaxID=191078 RepID=UPI002A8170BA|nr:APGW-amide-related neuropeptide-like [Saccostrea echinata]
MESASIFLIVTALVIGIVSTDDELIDKRRPGWGKRSNIDLETDFSDSIMEKRKPGWGKRDMNELEMNKRKPGWGKRAGLNSEYIDKRSPGWGKRSFNEDIKSFIDKRRPGWGKRTADLLDSLNAEIYKRKPGWGKRSEMEKRKPGWGKRAFPEPSDKDSSYFSLPSDISNVFNKRAPGWGKRTPESDIHVERRRPGWGKRAPGWGKRSIVPTCQDIDLEMQQLLNTILKLEEKRRFLCDTQSMTSGEFESSE